MSRKLRRRTLLVTLRTMLLEWLPAWWLMSATTACDDDAGAEPADAALAGDAGDESVEARFEHGVASGDPLADRVVLWTRVTGAATTRIAVAWEVATDAAFADIVATGDAQAASERDYTVKVDAGALEPGRAYHYRFHAGSAVSEVGRTRTLSADAVDRLRLAVMSCASYMSGYFNSYGDITKLDVDAVLHLGHYIYEYGTETSRWAPPNQGEANRYASTPLPASSNPNLHIVG